jgi:hypothetical protein
MQSLHRCGGDASAGEHYQPEYNNSFHEVIFELCVNPFGARMEDALSWRRMLRIARQLRLPLTAHPRMAADEPFVPATN